MKRNHVLLAAVVIALAFVGVLVLVLQSHGDTERNEKVAQRKAERNERSRPAEVDRKAAAPQARKAGSAARTEESSDEGDEDDLKAPAAMPASPVPKQPAGITARTGTGAAPTARTPVPEDDDRPAPVDNQGTIEGRVLNEAGKPVAGAMVTAAAATSAALLSASSGTEGRFAFDGVAPGPWQLTARKDQATATAGPVVVANGQTAQVTIYLGVVSCLAGTVLDAETREPVPNVRLEAFDAQRKHSAPAFSSMEGKFYASVPAPGTYRLYLQRGQKYLAGQTGFSVELAAGECRRDLVFFVREGITLTGTVWKEAETVADAHIVLVDLLNDQGGNKGETVSDENGHFSFVGQKPGGNYVARAIHPEHGMGESDPVLTRPGAALGRLDVHLQPGRTVGGRLVTHLGKGVPGLEIWIIRDRGQPWRPMPGTRAVSAADGNFSMRNIPAGEYQFVVSTAKTTRLSSDSFVVNEGEDPERLEINLGEGPEGFIEGRVTSPEGEPLRSVEVICHPISPRMVGTIDTDAEGRYRIDGLGPAPKHTVWARGYRLGRVRKPQRDVPVNSSNVDFVLGKMGTIAGRVVDAQTGEPVTGFHVKGPLVDRHIESPDGTFRIEDLQMSTGVFTFTSPGYASTTYDIGEIAEEQVVEGLEIKMNPGAWLEGKVSDEAGAPIQGARVKLVLQPKDLHDLDREFNWKASDPYTDSQGRFFLQGNPAGEPNSFVVWHPARVEHIVRDSMETKFEITLYPRGY